MKRLNIDILEVKYDGLNMMWLGTRNEIGERHTWKIPGDILNWLHYDKTKDLETKLNN